MQVLAYLAAALIGISLGLIGGGGSILTVPVLVYLFGTTPLLATSYSLFIVGSASLVGAINNYLKGLVSIKTALLFGLSSITTVFMTRRFIIPAIPKHIAWVGSFELTENILTMVLFAILMIWAARAMIRSGENKEEAAGKDKKLNIPKFMSYGIAIGLATGILGAGGGFLLIPALVLFVGLPMKRAIGTSLLIIALNSLIGFTGDLGHFNIDWLFLGKITAIAIAGIFIGGYLGKKIDGSKLKKGFGWFVLAMGIYIIIKELLLKK
ncbi:sulfite exporter TauE/SafE family protein [Mucilaginibacter sp. L3T2-6]|uniref:sulfite exporter TauE/SafE family protein n=1 Tax=Mucilaginibacter sp. L3T2-6 TaxID=3062491 RepID=UPI002675CD18|nr:sulfite exporter TauE/SafE family protein [Mucilaginibacter sp. L3T2-6]MDO3643805.1 sulfite exporter TauE/SafE family protein [Mucilaginibacter sp. L3T2-6]MDV6216256.1 sulfite exporter TauE/SafE family protein [Mucilaginibacter sp. L3T2-6]